MKNITFKIYNFFYTEMLDIYNVMLGNTLYKKTKSKISITPNGKYATLFTTILFFIGFGESYSNVRLVFLFFSIAILMSFLSLIIDRTKFDVLIDFKKIFRKNEPLSLAVVVNTSKPKNNICLRVITDPIVLSSEQIKNKHYDINISIFDKWVGFISYGINIELYKKIYFSDLAIQETEPNKTYHITTIPNKIGKTNILGFSVVYSDFFNLFVKKKFIPYKHELSIVPQRLNVLINNQNLLSFSNLGQGTTSSASDHDINGNEIISYRDYVIGDSLKSISWKQSAKSNKLISKELSAEKNKTLIIFIANSVNDELNEYICDIGNSIINYYYQQDVLNAVYINQDFFKPLNSNDISIIEHHLIINKDSYETKINQKITNIVASKITENNIIFVCDQAFYENNLTKFNTSKIKIIIYSQDQKIKQSNNLIYLNSTNIKNGTISI